MKVLHCTPENPEGVLVDAPQEMIDEQEAALAEKIANEEPEYSYNRRKAYPSIGEQLDALFHAGVFPEEMAAKIQAVKDENPKE